MFKVLFAEHTATGNNTIKQNGMLGNFVYYTVQMHSRASLLLKYTPDGANTREMPVYTQYYIFLESRLV
jgi:hypothetical protein